MRVCLSRNFLRCSYSQYYDVAVIGGGSAGLGFALVFQFIFRNHFIKEGAKLGLNMVVFDYVWPSPQGSKWGLGGTCVNVGCIPKKLMHQSSLLGESALSSRPFGWQFDFNEDSSSNTQLISKFSWETLRGNVQDYIKGLNFGYKSQLGQLGVDYINALASVKDQTTLMYKLNGEDREVKFKYCVIATGGRPTTFKNVEQHAITSDDIFMLEKAPGKTLIVGGGYVALECGGFLAGLGYDVVSMTRGKYLREFDGDMGQMIVEHLSKHQKINIVQTSLPVESEKLQNGRIRVGWKSTVEKEGQVVYDEFDTVLVAIGRRGNTEKLNLKNVGMNLNGSNGKIQGGVDGELEKTNVEGFYALGDVIEGVPELTPVAQKSGQLLARRLKHLLGHGADSLPPSSYYMDYNDYPTTVFTPVEYSCVGLSEEQARKKHSEIEVYHSKFVPLEEQLCDRLDENNEPLQRKVYVKAIVEKESDKVLGLHYLGPNAGEVMQGYAVAMKLGMKMSDLKRTIGIHPTCSEEFVMLKVTKSSGEDFEKHGC